MNYRLKYFILPHTSVGRSFRDIINNDTRLIQNRGALLATIKNTARQWFPNQNLLDNAFVLSEGRVRYMAEMISRPWATIHGLKGPDRMWCEGITIPIRPAMGHYGLHSAIELCIAAGNSQMHTTKPTVGLRMKHKGSDHWTPIDWQASPTELRSNLRRYASAAYSPQQPTASYQQQDSGKPQYPVRFKNGVAAESLGVQEQLNAIFNGADIQCRPESMLGLFPRTLDGTDIGKLYAEQVENAEQVVPFLTPEDRIDFTAWQMAMAKGFNNTERPEIAAEMASLAIQRICSRCTARYGEPGDIKKANVLRSELDNPADPWLAWETADETYLWMLYYIHSMFGECHSDTVARPIAEALSTRVLDELVNVVERNPTPGYRELVGRLREMKAYMAIERSVSAAVSYHGKLPERFSTEEEVCLVVQSIDNLHSMHNAGANVDLWTPITPSHYERFHAAADFVPGDGAKRVVFVDTVLKPLIVNKD